MIMSRHQTTGQNHKKVANESFENVSKYLETTATNQSCIHDAIKSRPNSGNASRRAVLNILSSRLLPKNVNIKEI
jgi:hypothetical protein